MNYTCKSIKRKTYLLQISFSVTWNPRNIHSFISAGVGGAASRFQHKKIQMTIED